MKSTVAKVASLKLALALAVICASESSVARADDGGSGPLTASTTVMRGYVRPQLADGSHRQETYVVNEGGVWSSPTADPTFDPVTFDQVVTTAVPALRHENYVPSKTIKDAALMIKIFWGGTEPKSGAKALDDMIDVRNALLTGYEEELQKYYRFRGTALSWRSLTPMDELKDSTGRYFVILVAYDYQFFLKNHKQRPLWMTRLSFPQRRTAFDKSLGQMMQQASVFFGKPTKTLVHKQIPTGRVDFGELRVQDMPAKVSE